MYHVTHCWSDTLDSWENFLCKMKTVNNFNAKKISAKILLAMCIEKIIKKKRRERERSNVICYCQKSIKWYLGITVMCSHLPSDLGDECLLPKQGSFEVDWDKWGL